MAAEPVAAGEDGAQGEEGAPLEPDLEALQERFGPPQPRDPRPGQLRLLPEEEGGDEGPAEEDGDGH